MISSSIYSAQGFVAPIPGADQESLFKQFLALFPSRGNTLIRKVGGGQYRRMSQYHYLTDDEIRASISNDPTYLRACGLDTRTRFAMVSIPGTSKYADSAEFARLFCALTSCGYKPKCYKAADCDDIQIYLSFTESLNSNLVRQMLSDQLFHLGFELASDTLTVSSPDTSFPLPLQAGFAWLNDNLTIKLKRDDISYHSALALFIADWTRSAVPSAVLLNAIIVPPAVQEEEPLIEDSDQADSLSNEGYRSHWSTTVIPDPEPIAAPIDLELPDSTASEHNELTDRQIDLAPIELIIPGAHVPISFRLELAVAPLSSPKLPTCEPVARSPDQAQFFSTGPPVMGVVDLPGRREIGAQLLLFSVPRPRPTGPELGLRSRRGRRPRSDPEAALQKPAAVRQQTFSRL